VRPGFPFLSSVANICPVAVYVGSHTPGHGRGDSRECLQGECAAVDGAIARAARRPVCPPEPSLQTRALPGARQAPWMTLLNLRVMPRVDLSASSPTRSAGSGPIPRGRRSDHGILLRHPQQANDVAPLQGAVFYLRFSSDSRWAMMLHAFSVLPFPAHRGRNARCRAPPAQIPACSFPAPGSSL